MTEEIQNEVLDTPESTEEIKDTPKEVDTPSEPSDVEKRALEMGWRPQSEFEGNEEDFIDAKEFVRRKPLFEKIDGVGKELRETKKALRALQAHHEKVKEAEYNNALKALREEKKAALESGDADRLIQVDEELAATKLAQAQAQQIAQQQAQQPHPNFVQWVQANPWYQSNPELRVTADQIGTAFAAANPNASPDEVLKYVGQRVRKLFPENFSNPNKTRPSAVEGSTSTPARKPSNPDDVSNYPMTDEERKVMMTFVRQGIMTKEEYIRDLKSVKGQ